MCLPEAQAAGERGERVCYDCLKSYGNQIHHEKLDKTTGLDFFGLSGTVFSPASSSVQSGTGLASWSFIRVTTDIPSVIVPDACEQSK